MILHSVVTTRALPKKSNHALLLNHQFKLEIAYPLELVDCDVSIERPTLDADRYVPAYRPQTHQNKRAHVVYLVPVRIAFGRKALKRPVLDPTQTVLVELRLQRKKEEKLNC